MVTTTVARPVSGNLVSGQSKADSENKTTEKEFNGVLESESKKSDDQADSNAAVKSAEKSAEQAAMLAHLASQQRAIAAKVQAEQAAASKVDISKQASSLNSEKLNAGQNSAKNTEVKSTVDQSAQKQVADSASAAMLAAGISNASTSTATANNIKNQSVPGPHLVQMSHPAQTSNKIASAQNLIPGNVSQQFLAPTANQAQFSEIMMPASAEAFVLSGAGQDQSGTNIKQTSVPQQQSTESFLAARSETKSANGMNADSANHVNNKVHAKTGPVFSDAQSSSAVPNQFQPNMGNAVNPSAVQSMPQDSYLALQAGSLAPSIREASQSRQNNRNLKPLPQLNLVHPGLQTTQAGLPSLTMDAPIMRGPGPKTTLARETVQQLGYVIGGIQRNSADGGEIRMKLKPNALGEVKIDVRTEGGKVSLRIEAQDESAKRLIESSLSTLETGLKANHQLSLSRVEVFTAPQSNNGVMDSNAFLQQNSVDNSAFNQSYNQANGRSAYDQQDGQAAQGDQQRQQNSRQFLSEDVPVQRRSYSGVNNGGQRLDMIA